MANQATNEELTTEQAQKLLSPLGDVSVTEISRAATTNDVFRVVTRAHGTYYVKFHTARWYADQPDTFFVVERECAVCDFLRKRGMPLPYRAWGDFTRSVVSRSVFICGELGGVPLPNVLNQYPEQRANILRAFGRYMRQLHGIEFSTPGLFAYAHAYFGDAIPVPPVCTWDQGGLHRPEHFQRDALQVLEVKRPLLPGSAVARLSVLFQSLADVIRPDYAPPRFTVGNCHAWHFHVDQVNGAWIVKGFYDFEAVSAGDPNIDLVELDVTLTPALGGSSWRDPFFEGYGTWPQFEGYKRRLFYYLLCEVGNPYTRQIPDPVWLNDRWQAMIDSNGWQELEWFPGKEVRGERCQKPFA